MDSVNYALQTEGFPQRSKQEIRAFVGNGVANLVHRAVPKGTPQPIEARCLGTFRAHYANNMNHKTAPYPGTVSYTHLFVKSTNSFCVFTPFTLSNSNDKNMLVVLNLGAAHRI